MSPTGQMSVPWASTVMWMRMRRRMGRVATSGGRTISVVTTAEMSQCEEFRVPARAFLEHTGNRWQCERGYKRVKEKCQGVQVPAPRFSAHRETAGSASGASGVPAIAVLRSDDPWGSAFCTCPSSGMSPAPHTRDRPQCLGP